MKLMFSAVAAFAALVSAPASASTSASSSGAAGQSGADAKQKDDPNAVRCERRASTGSRVRRQRICMTNAQWEQLARENQSDASGLQDRATIDPAGGD